MLLLLSGCDPEPPERNTEADESEAETAEPDTKGIRIVRGPTLSDRPLLSDHALRLPPSGVSTQPGLERQAWTVASYGNPAQLLAVPSGRKGMPAEEQPIRLALELFGGPNYSTAIYVDGNWNLGVADGAETALLIYNASDAAMQGSVAYSQSASCVWHESRPFVLKPGWNSLRVRQSGAAFKTESSNWQHTVGLWRPGDCRSITLLFHNGRRTGRFFVDSVRVAESTETRRRQRPIPQSPK